MKIVILGAGTVGSWIADLLCQKRHSVTVVDADPAHIKRINEELDVRALTGQAGHASVLFQADVLTADLCLAVTGDDEVNLVAASMAKGMGARRSIARVFAPVFRDLSTFDYQRYFHIDRILSLEHLSALELARNIRRAEAITMEGLARGVIEVQEMVVSDATRSVSRSLKDLRLPRGVRIASICRKDRLWIAGADDQVLLNDRITIVGSREHVDEVRDMFRSSPEPRKRVVIAGGGETGHHLARMLRNERFSVKLMEISRQRCEVLANNLPHVTVVQADATRRAVLEEERVGSADVFVACAGDDEDNIMAGVEASEIGAAKIMAIVGRPDYADIVGRLGIHVAVSPRDVMAKQIFSFLQSGPVVARMPLPGGTISVYEIEVAANSPAMKHRLAELPLPDQCLIVAVMRAEFAMVPGADDRLQAEDTIIALIDDRQLPEVLSSFTVNNGNASS